jgi:hypothetical protein
LALSVGSLRCPHLSGVEGRADSSRISRKLRSCVGEDGVMAFTDFGIENLMDLVKMQKENPKLLTR